jgi:hypothetical protein
MRLSFCYALLDIRGFELIAGEKLGQAVSWLGEKLAWVGQQFGTLFSAIIEGIKNVDMDTVTDLLTTGLFAGIAIGIKKLIDRFKSGEGLSFGFMDKINEVLDGVTGKLDAMQQQLKSKALLNIAMAIGILAISLLLLSTIPAEKLKDALAATAIGFAQLAGAMAVLMKIDFGASSSVKLVAIGAAMIIVAGAMLVMALAAKVMASMDNDELQRGLLGVGVLLTAITAMMKANPSQKDMISTGIGIVAIAAGMFILSMSVAVLGSMDVEALKKGLVSVSVLLVAMTAAVKAMGNPKRMVATGVGIAAMAVGILILSGAVAIFGKMDPNQLIQGLWAIGVLLLGITAAVNFMPKDMLIIGLGMVAIGIGLGVMMGAVITLGSMDIFQLIQGLAGVALLLGILAIATNAMASPMVLVGAAAILVLSGALLVMSIAVSAFAALGWGGLAVALVGIVAILLIFAGAAALLTPLIPAMFALGLAMMVFGLGLAFVGASVFLVGAGLLMLVTALGALVSLIADNSDGVVAALKFIIEAVIELIKNIFTTTIELAKLFVSELPSILAGLGASLLVILEIIKQALPEVFVIINELLTGIIQTLRDRVPELITAGFEILIALLTGIKDNIEQITNLAVDIIVSFLETLTERAGDLVTAGSDLIIALMNGLEEKVPELITNVVDLVVAIINALKDNAQRLIDAGKELVIAILFGIGNAVLDLMAAGLFIALQVMQGISDNVDKLVRGGVFMVLKILQGISDNIQLLIRGGAMVLINFLNGLADAIETYAPQIRAAGRRLASAIVTAIVDSIKELGGLARDAIGGLAGGMIDRFKGVIQSNSPSKVFYDLAQNIVTGVAKGMNANEEALNSADQLGSNVISAFQSALGNASASLEGMSEFNPTITPVLDLTNVKDGAGQIGKLVGTPELSASVSLGQARSISAQENSNAAVVTETAPVTKEITFNQVINAPKPLRTADVYRETKSQITLAKEKLKL